MGDKVDLIECKMLENSKAAKDPTAKIVHSGEQAPGNGMIDIGDGKVVVDNHVAHEPDFSKYEFHRIFRATDSK